MAKTSGLAAIVDALDPVTLDAGWHVDLDRVADDVVDERLADR